MEFTGDIEIQNYSNNFSSKSENLYYNFEEWVIFVEKIIESKNILQIGLFQRSIIQQKDSKEIILYNPLDSPIKDSLLKKPPFELFIFIFEDILYKFVKYNKKW